MVGYLNIIPQRFLNGDTTFCQKVLDFFAYEVVVAGEDVAWDVVEILLETTFFTSGDLATETT